MKKILHIGLVIAGMLALTRCGAALQYPEGDDNPIQEGTDFQQDEKNRDPFGITNHGTLDDDANLDDDPTVMVPIFGPQLEHYDHNGNFPRPILNWQIGTLNIPPPPPPPPVDPKSVDIEEFL